jgi:hypothetical protein
VSALLLLGDRELDSFGTTALKRYRKRSVEAISDVNSDHENEVQYR